MHTQCDHGFKATGQFVVMRTDPTFFLEQAEQPPNTVAFSALSPVKQPRHARSRLAVHPAQRNHRLHAVAIAVLTQDLAVMTLVGKHITAMLARVPLAARKADLIQQRREIARVSLFARRQQDGQREAMAVAG